MDYKSLPARLDPEITDFLSSEEAMINDSTEAFGSPLHFVFPQLLSQNADRFRKIFQDNSLREAQIYFASKVNKAESFLEEAAKSEIGVDVSSIQELRSALAHGIPGKRISVSGPSKRDRLLALAAQHDCTISVDSDSELDSLLVLLQKINVQDPSILIRLGGLSTAFTRFGIASKDLPSILSKISAGNARVNLKGFHFHLSDYSTEERINALQTAILELQKARSLGHACDTINMGGGFAARYIDPQSWKDFQSGKSANMFAGSKDIESFYPYGSEQGGEAQLEAILTARTEAHTQIADLLRTNNIRLAIEPGRSLVDQAGITCMQVKGVKQTSDGTYVIEVDANINHLSEQWYGSEFCVDPIHLRKNPDEQSASLEAAVAGNTCLEIDMLSWRKIGFTSTPKAGDLLVYANTAGYQMDSNESTFHRLPIPEKIAAFKKQGKWKWKKDSEYSFLDPM